MSITLLQERIDEGIKDNEGGEQTRFRHYKTALNNLLDNNIVNPKDLQLALGEDLENTVSKLKEILISKGKSDTRSPLTRVRRLSEYYQQIFDIDDSGMTFSQLLQAAVLRKHDNLWTEEVTPKTQSKITAKGYITYRHVAKDIIITSKETYPEAWENVDLKKPTTLGSASKVLRDYITGESIPSERVPDERIHFIERYLLLPKNSLLSKIGRKIDHADRGRTDKEKAQHNVNKVKLIHKNLNDKLQKVFDEYSAYKLHGTQPEIKNISEKLAKSRHFKILAKVKEINRKTVNWTVNSKGKCGSQDGFKSQLLGFQHYCVTELGMNFEDIGSEQLSDPTVFSEIVEWASTKQTGASWVDRLLNWVHRGIQDQGYLRLCADVGENRTQEEFFDDLDLFKSSYIDWAKEIKKGIGESGKGGKKGKQNIDFLLQIQPYSERRRVMFEASCWLMQKAEMYQRDAHFKLKAANKAPGPVAREKYLKSASTFIRKAFNYAKVAFVQEVSFINIPRSDNWTMLKYYPNAKVQDSSYASMTFLRQQNRYQLFIPCHGSSLVDDDAHSVRYIKNADSENATDIDVQLPERITPLIKKLLSIRKDYIEMDLVPYGDCDPETMDILLPWRSIRAEDTDDEVLLAIREKFIHSAAKFGENFCHLTYTAYLHILPEAKQHGINIHAMRHIVAETHLEENPGDYIGAASKLNDDVDQIIRTYGDKDRSKSMKRVAELESEGFEYKF
ncbi:hypothetical protein SAMN05216262_1318 [Colwellia chukchiensis]|uniref:Uncharacterized protein n=1 Tax=Colwellia chukchiensis TaxID=641665 RepID=A0A1H7TZZ7_9GAMM|nr:hypothetical protein [Colwellia chukchiensis]SEL90008.1 hypothetical protein SAMN05216262_1318 [Colwellia chukchiensis]